MNDIQPESKGAVARTTATPEDIVGKELVTYDIASDGSRFRMSFVCTDGKRGSLSLPTESLQALIMTLPRMMAQALRARHGDESLRLVYPAEAVRIEESRDPNRFILTLTTPVGRLWHISARPTQERVWPAVLDISSRPR
jgi:hypothetical protein